ncbi:MAG: radical SAM protein [Thermodesulfobacteriota bacterium]|nr:radical SAM protein [Thermodesulfobacteriota bacterium]
MEPSYYLLWKSGELERRVARALTILLRCELCPRCCRVNRVHGERGFCRSGFRPKVSSYQCHHGEEPPISGLYGSGTVFFAYCTLQCCFCQNYPISHLGKGTEVSVERLVDYFLELQGNGCHNINLVSPTHFIPQILHSIFLAVQKGLDIPIVYNSNGYERPHILQLLDGIVDIYLPDMKYSDNDMSMRYSNAPHYFVYAKEAVKEMYRQVGNLKIRDDIAWKGLLVRHLVLPDGRAGTEKIIAFLAEEISSEVFISVMKQYYPYCDASQFPEINREITQDEYAEICQIMEHYHITNGWIQEPIGLPDRQRYAGENILRV